MKNYLNTLLNEKGISTETVLEVQGADWGTNFIPVSSVLEFINNLDINTKAKIKANFIKIDFLNGDIMHFMNYIAKGMAI
jgi:hypothetical protein|tara:strand:+ start:93 stop:332 length:240 start_codon:yes stop_codon:yes gene_type:complete